MATYLFPYRTASFSKVVVGQIALEIAFDTAPLRSMCEDQDTAKLMIGDGPAEILKHRLADLRAAVSITDIVVGNARILDGSDNMLIDLCEGCRITLRANHVNKPVKKDGKLDWTKVTRVKILSVGVVQ